MARGIRVAEACLVACGLGSEPLLRSPGRWSLVAMDSSAEVFTVQIWRQAASERPHLTAKRSEGSGALIGG